MGEFTLLPRGLAYGSAQGRETTRFADTQRPQSIGRNVRFFEESFGQAFNVWRRQGEISKVRNFSFAPADQIKGFPFYADDLLTRSVGIIIDVSDVKGG